MGLYLGGGLKVGFYGMFLGCFENLKEFDYLCRKVFRKVLKRSSASLSGIYHLDFRKWSLYIN